jgi:putative spermidine/putrescine transport system permease protein
MDARVLPAAAAPRRPAVGMWGSLTPLLLLLVLWFFVPITILLLTSFYHYQGGQIVRQLTLDNYAKVFTNGFYLRMLARTVYLGAATGSLAVLLGYPVAYFLVRGRSRWRGVLTAVAFMPLLASVVVSTYAWLVLLGDQGLVNTVLRSTGIIHAPLRFVYNFTGVVIGLTHAVLPYAVLAIMAALQGIDPVLERAAMNLGASPVRTFLRVTLPLSLSGVAAGFLLAFAAAISAYVIPKILGGGFIATTGTEIYDQMVEQLNWPLGATIAVVVLVLVVGSLTLIGRFRGRPAEVAL